MAFNEFPYMNFHELNADWILQTVKQALEIIDNLNATITAMQAMDTSLQTEITGLQHANEAINAQLDTIESTLEDHTGSLETFAELIAEIRGELGAMQAAVNSLLGRTTSIEGMLADTYDETQHYFKPAIVREEGKLWRCIVDESVPSGATGQFDETDWTEINVGDELALLQTRFSALAGVVDELQQMASNVIPIKQGNIFSFAGSALMYNLSAVTEGGFFWQMLGENLWIYQIQFYSTAYMTVNAVRLTVSLPSLYTITIKYGGGGPDPVSGIKTPEKSYTPKIVTFTKSGASVTCNLTFSQILSAYNDSQPIYAIFSDPNTLRMQNACIHYSPASSYGGVSNFKFTWFSATPATQFSDWTWDSVSVTIDNSGNITYNMNSV